ncbi:unnamed protein product [Urochloa decumbens]|uniref:F-box domain-containing protein n=1 Tax=Urochloa decumbens TaxID=240449 RepID=A0ABC8Y8M7_9POAL
MDAAAGDPDRISALPDDLLHLILGFLPETTAAARTAVLSRRWRHVWVHARNLVLSDVVPTAGYAGRRCRATPGYFAGFVDRLFARRGDAGIGSLTIRLYNHQCTPPEKVAEWIRYAVQHAADSFLPRIAQLSTATIELPSHGTTASIKLNLYGSTLRLPSPAAASTYGALTELVLHSPLLDGGGRALGDFASSCCPRLRKLDIGIPMCLPELVLRADALEELRLYHSEDLRELDVTAPNLRVLVVDRCFFRSEPAHDDDVSTRRVARVVAPRLEAIGMRDAPFCKHPDLDIHGLAGVCRLGDLYLNMTGRYYRDASAGVWLLENCPGVEHVELSLGHRCGGSLGFPADEVVNLPEFWTPGELIDLAAEGTAPFGSVKSLKVDMKASYFPQNHLVESMSSLLLRCPRLTSLSISKRASCTCQCSYDDSGYHRKISLGSLAEVEISGFTGKEEETDLVSLLFESSSSIKRMTLLTRAAKILGSQPWKVTVPPSWNEADHGQKIDPLVAEKLKGITCSTGQGRWDIKEEEGVYTWTY